MKTIDFTKTGGFPLTQNGLDYLQSAYNEALLALGKMGAAAANVPVLLEGMGITTGVSTLTIAEGWVLYNGELIRCPSGTISSSAPVGDSLYLNIVRTSLPLTYNDGSTNNVVNEAKLAMQYLTTGTANNGTAFSYASIIRFGVNFGAKNRDSAWTTITITDVFISSDCHVYGSIKYKMDYLTNVLYIKGAISTIGVNTQPLLGVVGAAAIATLPIEPSELTPLLAMHDNTYGFYVDPYPALGFTDLLMCYLGTDGKIYLSAPKANAEYNIYIKGEVLLD